MSRKRVLVEGRLLAVVEQLPYVNELQPRAVVVIDEIGAERVCVQEFYQWRFWTPGDWVGQEVDGQGRRVRGAETESGR